MQERLIPVWRRPVKLRELLKIGYVILKESGISAYQTDTQLILSHAIGCDRLYVLTNPDEDIRGEHKEIFIKNLNKRANGYPLQYIIGKTEFYSMDFYVDESVLIPRCDTEVLVDAAVKHIGGKNSTVVEIGTGSGIISICVAKHCKNARVIAADISKEALTVAKKNASLNGAEVVFRQGDIFSALREGDYPADFIISNPPYIETDEINTLDISVRDYEPRIALDGGSDGLRFYREIISNAGGYLSPGGMMLLEIGCTQAEPVKKILTQYGFTDITITRDTALRDRVIEAKIK